MNDRGAAPTAAWPEARSSTFTPNLKLPVHGWYRFSAGYSAQWAERWIAERATAGARVLDPFCGSATTLLAAERAGVAASGLESHPFVYRIARAKLCYRDDPDALLALGRRVVARAQTLDPEISGYPTLIRRCFRDEALGTLDTLRRASRALDDGSPAAQLVWLALLSILRPVSHVGTAPWQYVLPGRTKRFAADPRLAFERKLERMTLDMRAAHAALGPRAHALRGDARTCEPVGDASVDLVLTSPPYPNNFDYADATRLEMTFFREIDAWRDLQGAVRRHLVRSCTQHCPERELALDALLSRPELAPLGPALSRVCGELAELRAQRAGRKTYHLMIACYFFDMARTWQALRRVCRDGARLCLVIGDSAPYGVHVPVVDWMGELARQAGFSDVHFEKTRDRNIKWRNRTHRVPLCEGRLSVSG